MHMNFYGDSLLNSIVFRVSNGAHSFHEAIRNDFVQVQEELVAYYINKKESRQKVIVITIATYLRVTILLLLI